MKFKPPYFLQQVKYRFLFMGIPAIIAIVTFCMILLIVDAKRHSVYINILVIGYCASMALTLIGAISITWFDWKVADEKWKAKWLSDDSQKADRVNESVPPAAS